MKGKIKDFLQESRLNKLLAGHEAIVQSSDWRDVSDLLVAFRALMDINWKLRLQYPQTINFLIKIRGVSQNASPP